MIVKEITKPVERVFELRVSAAELIDIRLGLEYLNNNTLCKYNYSEIIAEINRLLYPILTLNDRS